MKVTNFKLLMGHSMGPDITEQHSQLGNINNNNNKQTPRHTAAPDVQCFQLNPLRTNAGEQLCN